MNQRIPYKGNDRCRETTWFHDALKALEEQERSALHFFTAFVPAICYCTKCRHRLLKPLGLRSPISNYGDRAWPDSIKKSN